MPVAVGCYDVMLENITVNHIDDDGLDINALAHSTIIGCYIQDCTDNAIDTDNMDWCVIADNVITSCGHGIELEDDAGTGWSGTRLHWQLYV